LFDWETDTLTSTPFSSQLFPRASTPRGGIAKSSRDNRV
jgi:hypothetical protein